MRSSLHPLVQPLRSFVIIKRLFHLCGFWRLVVLKVGPRLRPCHEGALYKEFRTLFYYIQQTDNYISLLRSYFRIYLLVGAFFYMPCHFRVWLIIGLDHIPILRSS